MQTDQHNSFSFIVFITSQMHFPLFIFCFTIIVNWCNCDSWHLWVWVQKLKMMTELTACWGSSWAVACGVLLSGSGWCPSCPLLGRAWLPVSVAPIALHHMTTETHNIWPLKHTSYDHWNTQHTIWPLKHTTHHMTTETENTSYDYWNIQHSIWPLKHRTHTLYEWWPLKHRTHYMTTETYNSAYDHWNTEHIIWPLKHTLYDYWNIQHSICPLGHNTAYNTETHNTPYNHCNTKHTVYVTSLCHCQKHHQAFDPECQPKIACRQWDTA